MDFETFKRLPKAELHIHLEGAIGLHRLLQFSAEHNDHIWSGLGATELAARFCTDSFQGFINEFLTGYRLLQKPRHFQIVTEDLCAYFQDQGIVHAEVFYSPGIYFQQLGVPIEDIHSGIRAGLAQFPGMSVRFIVDTVINMGSAFMERTLRAVLAANQDFVRGFSIGGGRPDLDMRQLVPLFRLAERHGLFSVAHVGEVDGAENIRILLEETKLIRIGHGLAAEDDEEVMALIREKNVAIDVSLSSNLRTGTVKDLRSHPLKTFMDRGILITLNTDDPCYFETDLYREYLLAQRELQLPDDILMDLARNSLDAASTARGYS